MVQIYSNMVIDKRLLENTEKIAKMTRIYQVNDSFFITIYEDIFATKVSIDKENREAQITKLAQGLKFLNN